MVANISAVFIWQVCICSAESAKSHIGMIALQPLDAAYIARLAGVITSHIVSCSIIVFQLSCGIFLRFDFTTTTISERIAGCHPEAM